MDSLIVKAAYEREDIRITGGVGPVGREYIGSDIGLVSGLGRSIGALVSDNLEDVINECDLVVIFPGLSFPWDFSKPADSIKKPSCAERRDFLQSRKPYLRMQLMKFQL